MALSTMLGRGSRTGASVTSVATDDGGSTRRVRETKGIEMPRRLLLGAMVTSGGSESGVAA
ncbi:hypothetical protein GCM10009617_29150 [Leifsonia poae]|uniref:Uncharacterized protein n=1 Tax=Leifsonia poae TaxID=110933 RepID=A0A9W6H7S0_9MICO|nr:hypothetical protein GCM10017584_10900 [Leifsonia poae]